MINIQNMGETLRDAHATPSNCLLTELWHQNLSCWFKADFTSSYALPMERRRKSVDIRRVFGTSQAFALKFVSSPLREHVTLNDQSRWFAEEVLPHDWASHRRHAARQPGHGKKVFV